MIHNGRSRKLPFDPVAAVKHLRAIDPKLAVLIDCAGPFTLRLDHTASLCDYSQARARVFWR
jgi:hypothetical protein